MRLFLPVITAFILLFILFSPWTSPHINFWYGMSITTAILASLSFFLANDWKRQLQCSVRCVVMGFLSAAVLWGIFFIGNALSTAIFPFAGGQIDAVYALKAGQSPFVIVVLLLFLIGPAEEIFWRGYVQRKLAEKISPLSAFVITTILYAGAHLSSGNVMLVLAALVCGAFWGYLYQRTGRLGMLVVSHALWDVAVFIIFPIKTMV